MGKIGYRLHQIEPEGLWTSEPFPPADRRHIVQNVIAGFLNGHPRWATALDGTFIYGLDAKGNEIKSAPSHARKKARVNATKRASRHHATRTEIGPRVLKIGRDKTFAALRSIAATIQYAGEPAKRVEFVGPNKRIGGSGPVVMIMGGYQTFVTDPSRFGDFGPAWVRRFFEG
jgi:hypothetical protein